MNWKTICICFIGIRWEVDKDEHLCRINTELTLQQLGYESRIGVWVVVATALESPKSLKPPERGEDDKAHKTKQNQL